MVKPVISSSVLYVHAKYSCCPTIKMPKERSTSRKKRRKNIRKNYLAGKARGHTPTLTRSFEESTSTSESNNGATAPIDRTEGDSVIESAAESDHSASPSTSTAPIDRTESGAVIESAAESDHGAGSGTSTAPIDRRESDAVIESDGPSTSTTPSDRCESDANVSCRCSPVLSRWKGAFKGMVHQGS